MGSRRCDGVGGTFVGRGRVSRDHGCGGRAGQRGKDRIHQPIASLSLYVYVFVCLLRGGSGEASPDPRTNKRKRPAGRREGKKGGGRTTERRPKTHSGAHIGAASEEGRHCPPIPDLGRHMQRAGPLHRLPLPHRRPLLEQECHQLRVAAPAGQHEPCLGHDLFHEAPLGGRADVPQEGLELEPALGSGPHGQGGVEGTRAGGPGAEGLREWGRPGGCRRNRRRNRRSR